MRDKILTGRLRLFVVLAGGRVVDTGEGVDLTTQFVNMKLAETAYAAAAKVMSTANQMTDALLAAI